MTKISRILNFSLFKLKGSKGKNNNKKKKKELPSSVPLW
jgi:hypothetical protein